MLMLKGYVKKRMYVCVLGDGSTTMKWKGPSGGSQSMS